MTQTVTSRATTPGAPAKRHLGLALFVIATAQLMVVLDAAIVNVALPHVQRALGFSGSGLEWVVTAYAVTFGGLLLLGGRSGDLLGRRRIFIAGLLVFSARSEEHTSELQSRQYLVCRLLLEKKTETLYSISALDDHTWP